MNSRRRRRGGGGAGGSGVGLTKARQRGRQLNGDKEWNQAKRNGDEEEVAKDEKGISN